MKGFVILGALILVQHIDGSAIKIYVPKAEDIMRELEMENRLIVPRPYDTASLEDTIREEESSNNELMAKLKNATIRVLARTNLPFLIIRRGGKNNETIRLTGFVGDLWNILQKHLGFKTKVLIGNQTTTRAWDLLLNPKELGTKRMRKYSYSFPVLKIWYNLFAKGVPDDSLSWFYFEVLDKKLWTIIFTVMVVLSAFLWLAWKIRMTMKLSDMDAKDKRDTNFSTCLLSVLGCMTNQGSQFKLESLSSIRIITLMCILLGLIITTSFSALLISKLATFDGVKAVYVKLDVETLLKTPEGRTVCVANTSSAFRRLKDAVVRKKSSLKVNGPPCVPGEFDIVPVEDYCHLKAVVLETHFNAINTLSRNPDPDGLCPVFIYTKRHYESHMIIVAQKWFPYMKIINKYLLRIKESGIMGRLDAKWKSDYDDKRDDDFRPTKESVIVRFDHVRTIISLYGCAVVVVLILLAVEKVCCWLKVQQLNKIQT